MATHRIRELSKEKYTVYLHKANEFFIAMKNAEEEESWNAACLCAIHCTISTIDAITTFHLGLRSTGQGHEETTHLIKKTNLESSDEKAKQYTDIIRLKTKVEYDAEEPTEKEARRGIAQTERIYKWAKAHLPG